MKIYKITFNEWQYNHYDSFVVVAENEARVVELIKEKKDCGEDDCYGGVVWSEGYTIEEVPTDKEGVILGSFNAE
jgi:hypothetical protein